MSGLLCMVVDALSIKTVYIYDIYIIYIYIYNRIEARIISPLNREDHGHCKGRNGFRIVNDKLAGILYKLVIDPYVTCTHLRRFRCHSFTSRVIFLSRSAQELIGVCQTITISQIYDLRISYYGLAYRIMRIYVRTVHDHTCWSINSTKIGIGEHEGDWYSVKIDSKTFLYISFFITF